MQVEEFCFDLLVSQQISYIFENQILKIYKIYQGKIRDLNCCDFGDLILYCVKLFEKNPDIRKIYANNFKYILVDEYQDTNFIQNRWLNLIDVTDLDKI